MEEGLSKYTECGEIERKAVGLGTFSRGQILDILLVGFVYFRHKLGFRGVMLVCR